MSNNTLLPPNATELEKQLEQVGILDIENIITFITDANRCPERLLGILAIGWSVDEWRNDWDVQTKRQTLLDAIYIHKIKGTFSAVKRALSQINALVDIKQWYESNPVGEARTFIVTLQAQDQMIGGEVIASAHHKISLVKPASAHFDLVIQQDLASDLVLHNALTPINSHRINMEAA